MRWSPSIIGPWVARVLADHAWCTITRGMKWNEMDEMSVEKWWNEVCGRGKREKPREKSTQTPFCPPRNPHGGTETRTRDPSGGRRASNCLRHEVAIWNKISQINYSQAWQMVTVVDSFRWFSYTNIWQMALQPNPAEHSRDYLLPHEHSRDFNRYKSVSVLTPFSVVFFTLIHSV